MDVEDLIASMHVGREGYELKALQAHLSKTLNYNPDNIAVYQPVQGVHYVPPPPVSSLNSMASTSYGTSYHQFPTHPNLNAQPGRASRPQCTPAHSYRGFQPGVKMMEEAENDQHGDMDVEMDIGRPANHANERHSGLPSLPNQHDEGDFAGFSADAFAPIYQHDEVRHRFPQADGADSADEWGPFRKGPGASALTSSPPRWQTEPCTAMETSQNNGWARSEQSGSDNTGQRGHPSSPGLDRNSAGTWATGRLRNTTAREKRRNGDAKSNHKS